MTSAITAIYRFPPELCLIYFVFYTLMISSVLAFVTIFFTIRGKCAPICLKHVRATIHTVVTDWDCSILLQAGTQQDTIHLCFEIERSQLISLWSRQITFGSENGYSLLPSALTRSAPRVVLGDTQRERKKKEPCCRTSHQRTVPWLIASAALSRFGATHGCLRLSTCASGSGHSFIVSTVTFW